MKYLTFIFIASVLIISCGTNQEKQSTTEETGEISIDSLKSEVIAIHDEVMPKMGELRKTRKALEAMADSALMVSDSTNALVYIALAKDISSANEGMMQWMRAYEPEYEGTDEEVRQYLNDQKVAIQKVKEAMNGTLAKGQEVLEQY